MEVSNQEEESILGALACNDCNFIEDIDNNGYLFHSEEGNEYSEEENGFQNVGDFDGEFMGDITIGKTFSSLEEAYMFYNGYARSKGFGTRKHYTNRRKITNEIYMRQFVCNKQGFKDMNDKRRLGRDVKCRSITRTSCLAMMQVSLSKKRDWIVEKFHDEHNHPLDHSSNVIKQCSHNHFHLTDTCKDLVSLLLKANMRAPEITKVVNAIIPNQVFTQAYTKLKSSNVDGESSRFATSSVSSQSYVVYLAGKEVLRIASPLIVVVFEPFDEVRKFPQ